MQNKTIWLVVSLSFSQDSGLVRIPHQSESEKKFFELWAYVCSSKLVTTALIIIVTEMHRRSSQSSWPPE